MEFEALTLLGGVATGVVGNAVYAGITKPETLLPIEDYRKKALTRTWNGYFLMPEGNGQVEKVEIEMKLEVKRRTITGIGEYSDTMLDLKGGFFRGDYFFLNYENTDKSIFQRGMMIFYWPNNPTEIKGKFLGIRRVKDEIAAGEMVLIAQKNDI